MCLQIGFALLTHSNPPQILRLVDRLNRMFDEPVVVCHHDFSKCALDTAAFPPNVDFVLPHEITSWGRFSAVEAILRAVEKVFARPNPPDWVVLLSGADYPVKPAAAIREDLAASTCDAFVNHKEVTYQDRLVEPGRLCFRRYRTFRFHLPLPFRGNRAPRMFSVSNPLLTPYLTPFSPDFRCYFGETWFSANGRAIEYLQRFHRDRPALAKHYRRQETYRNISSDESYIQSILANAPGLRVDGDNRRYADWTAGGAHPKTLTVDDFERLTRSRHHFARKFDPAVDAQILDLIDHHLGIA